MSIITLNRNRKRNYLIGFFSLLIIEILIASFIKDDFIKPYLGDFLVVIMLYCFLMGISRFAIYKSLFIVLVFSFTIEFLQLIDIANLLQYQPPKPIMIILGNSFSVGDLVAYLLGLLSCLIIEILKNRTYSPST
ncbi:ribosomal maturation YjgA family protein [Salegentibacter mishustinae]|uniref:ribosomal maturation YjgA family protein n=1 Tax=Salegentibacter mishustinae TaxID=270918 RepID=UPI000CCF8CC3|nr:DUF2809 domain-containing protein [Salegentibacter mishustinae]PNW22136.1 hypothetical protein APB85_13045 [Salegentibacter mishustinae]PZX67348.1 uncharacterized protein DUF2809 [Salegentibacter mishustinae]